MALSKLKERYPKYIANVGIQDGKAGRWTTPNYLKYNTVTHKLGTKQYFSSVAGTLNKSLADYKQDKSNNT